jgi:hypothetical protein
MGAGMRDDIFWIMLLSICALLATPAHGCEPGAGGATSTCGGGPASQSNTSGVDVGAGNALNVITGNKYQREVDMPALPGVLGLEIVRHYNSAYSGPKEGNGLIGRGWKLSYETELHAIGRTLQTVQTVTTWLYDGARLIEIDHPRQLERYRHDAQGRIEAKTVILKFAGSDRIASTTVYRYDSWGSSLASAWPTAACSITYATARIRSRRSRATVSQHPGCAGCCRNRTSSIIFSVTPSA